MSTSLEKISKLDSQNNNNKDQVLLNVRDLTVSFATDYGKVKAVNGISFNLARGETLGIVGESGCGKSISMLAILQLIDCPPGKIEDGEVWIEGRNLLTLQKGEMRSLRGKKIAMIFQDPMTSLNPVFTIGDQITESLMEHEKLSKRNALKETTDLLKLVGIPNANQAVDSYPHQFSGGMRQRAMIAMALACKPDLLIADEPTTALDVTVQEQLLTLIKRLQEQFKMSLIWITHDLGVIAGVADRVNVMYAGRIVETGPIEKIFSSPKHPYTMALLKSVPRLDRPKQEILNAIPGSPPDLINLPLGCSFYERCSYKMPQCLNNCPSLLNIDEDHFSACWLTSKPNIIDFESIS